MEGKRTWKRTGEFLPQTHGEVEFRAFLTALLERLGAS